MSTARLIVPPAVAFLEERLRAPFVTDALAAPLREFLARSGKQIRARLVELSWALAGGHGEPPPGLALAAELLHAGSLVVDDIEDDSRERRGAPALHVAAGLPVALNAGNWLYFAALELIGELPLDDGRALKALRRAHELLARCHEGQALDVGVRVWEVPQREVGRLARTIAEQKTGGLASLCTTLAAICAGAEASVEASLASFGTALGAALQALDDCGGVACPARRPKGEEDLRNARATWAWALAAERASPARYQSLQSLAERVSRGSAAPGELLDELRPLVGDGGRSLARSLLEPALAALSAAVGPARALDEARALAAEMEESYG